MHFDSAAKLLTGLGFATEEDLAAEFVYVDWAQDLPGFPPRVKFNLKRHFVRAK